MEGDGNGHTAKQSQDGIPALAKVHCGGEEENLKHGIASVDAWGNPLALPSQRLLNLSMYTMIEQLSKRPTLVRSSSAAHGSGIIS